ncbi:MAG: nucleotidyltransferase family protein [Anaerolineae bacterium]|nr:nucleotidyltransferase family protein [Gemmatimonadaceae bacterium]
MHSLAVYNVLTDVLRGRPVNALRRRRAFRAPLALWQRVLAFEGCAVQWHHALRACDFASEAPQPLRRMLRDATSTALRRSILAYDQLTAVAALAEKHCIRVLALKGAARLLAGELGGTRSLGDIDLLVDPASATLFHSLLQRQLGYEVSGPAYAHHLPGLTRAGSLGIEVHFRISHEILTLDSQIWSDTRRVMLGVHAIEVPSPTNMVLHTMEHAAGLNWMGRYRLRDIIDVAAVFTSDVSTSAVRSYADASQTRFAFETLLSAAHELEPRVPIVRPGAWRTVRRVSRTRLAFAVLPRRRRVAERMFRYAGVLAEGSPRTLVRAGVSVARRGGAATLTAVLQLLGGCSDSTRPQETVVPPFVFVSDTEASPGLYGFHDGTVTQLSALGHEDTDPHSAAGKIVFTSRRDGNSEIYIADIQLATQQRLTQDPASDVEPALDPAGVRIAFTSDRSGTPRVWLVDATGANARPLATGSPDFLPEGAPSWSPSGEQVAFTSTRTGTSQVFLIGANGGQALQLTHEASGAFTPTWRSDGRNLLYVSIAQFPRLMLIPAAGGDPVLFASDDRGLGDPACAMNVCIAAAGPGDANGDIVSTNGAAGTTIRVVLGRAANDRHPAFLVP